MTILYLKRFFCLIMVTLFAASLYAAEGDVVREQMQKNLTELRTLSEPDSAKFMALAHQTESMAEELGDLENASLCYLYMINYSMVRAGDLEVASRYLQALKSFSERTGVGKSRFYSSWQNLILYYISEENRLLASSETNQLANYAKRNNDAIGMCYAYILYGHLSEHTYETSIENFEQAIKYAIEAENKQVEYNIHERMATIAFNNSEYEDALRFVKNMESMEVTPAWMEQVADWIRLASYVFLHNKAEADRYYQRMKPVWDKDEVYPIALGNYAMALCSYHCHYGNIDAAPDYFEYVSPFQKIQLQVEYYRVKKDFENALLCQIQLDSIFNEQSHDQQRSEVAAANAFFNNQELKDENQRLEMDKAASKSQRDMVIIIAMAFSLLGACYTIFTYRSHNKHLKAERDKTEKQRLIAEEQRKIAEEARKKAELLSDMKTTFIQNMNHEVRTPLNSIVGFNDLLNNSNGAEFSAEERAEMLAALNHQSRLLIKLLDDTIYLCRIDGREIKPRQEKVNLRNFIGSALDDIKENVKPGVKLEYDVEADVVLDTDSSLLYAAISHVLDNSVKFTSQGEIRVRLLPDSIVFSNTSTPIPAESAELVFERFEKLGSHNAGFGLGLSIARESLALIDATIKLDTTYTDGVCFVVRFKDGERA